nr:ribosomal protein S18-alanine N-acetyltransferase [Acidihalobacter prosperus]
MSSRPREAVPRMRPLEVLDLDALMGIERRAYSHPWTEAIFRDCLRAGYTCWAMDQQGELTGYAITSLAVGEYHILNLTVRPESQGRGYGRFLLRALVNWAKGQGAETAFLEVRPSNRTALNLYLSEGFNEVGLRKGYYPAARGREDALVMARNL